MATEKERTIIIDADIFKELEYMVQLQKKYGEVMQFENVAGMVSYILSSIADGHRRPGAWERSLLDSMGLAVDCDENSYYRQTYGRPELYIVAKRYHQHASTSTNEVIGEAYATLEDAMHKAINWLLEQEPEISDEAINELEQEHSLDTGDYDLSIINAEDVDGYDGGAGFFEYQNASASNVERRRLIFVPDDDE